MAFSAPSPQKEKPGGLLLEGTRFIRFDVPKQGFVLELIHVLEVRFPRELEEWP
jgi:hypothetical protein